MVQTNPPVVPPVELEAVEAEDTVALDDVPLVAVAVEVDETTPELPVDVAVTDDAKTPELVPLLLATATAEMPELLAGALEEEEDDAPMPVPADVPPVVVDTSK